MAKQSVSTKENDFVPLQDGQFAVASTVRKADDERLMSESKSKRKAARKTTKTKKQEREIEASRVHGTGGTKTHSNPKPMRSRKASRLDYSTPVYHSKQTEYPKEGYDTLAESDGLELENSDFTSTKFQIDSTPSKPTTTTRLRMLRRRGSLPPLQDTVTPTSSLLTSAAQPSTPNSALSMQKSAASPSVAQAEFSFHDNTRERKRHGELPPLSTLPPLQREPTLVVVPPTPTSKKPAPFLPKLHPIRSQLSSASSTSSNSEQCQFLSKSVPANFDERCVLSTPIHSSKSLNFFFPTCHTPSHLSYSSSPILSDSSLSSLNSSQSSPFSLSAAFSPSSIASFKYDGDEENVFYYPSPPPKSSKKSNTQRRRRPGCRLVPFDANKVDSLPLKLDPTCNNLEDTQEVEQSCSTKLETNYEDSEILKEYLRICPGRRGAICEKLEKNMNVVKINGKKYNLTTLRHELSEMVNAVKKYGLFFKTFKFFR